MDCKDEQHKVEVLSSIYGMLTIGQSIIFVRRRATADDIAAQMISEGHAVTSLHGTPKIFIIQVHLMLNNVIKLLMISEKVGPKF